MSHMEKESTLEKERQEEKPHYFGHRKRVKERFLKTNGVGFADYELLEILLFAAKPRADVKPLAKKIIAKFGSMAKVLNASPYELESIEELGESGVVQIKAAYEIALRMLKEDFDKKTIISSWKSLLDYCRAAMGNSKNEQFRIFFLDTKNQLIADELQQEGTIDHTPVYPREVVKRALELGAASIILAHNHPSGDPSPSKSDVDMTKKIIQAATPLGIQVHDHIIIAAAKHYSFKANGLL